MGFDRKQLNRQAAWRTLVTLVLAGATAAGVAWLRRDEVSFAAVNKQSKYRTVQWQSVCDTVLLGDSRVEIGMSPEDIEATLPGSSVRNFGFGGVGMTKEYMAAGGKVLDAKAPIRRVVIGITPRMFLGSSEAYNNFIEAQRAFGDSGKSSSRVGLWMETGPFRLMRPEALLEALAHDGEDAPKKTAATWTNYDNGWSSVATDNPKPEAKLESYEELFAAEQVADVLVEGFLKQVAVWRAEGIRVYATRVPVTSELYELENRASGLMPERFVERFESAGGVWFEFPMTYPTFDGTHLLESGARTFSRDLGARIAKYEVRLIGLESSGERQSDILMNHE